MPNVAIASKIMHIPQYRLRMESAAEVLWERSCTNAGKVLLQETLSWGNGGITRLCELKSFRASLPRISPDGKARRGLPCFLVRAATPEGALCCDCRRYFLGSMEWSVPSRSPFRLFSWLPYSHSFSGEAPGSASAGFAETDRDGLAGRTRAVLAMPYMLDLLVHKLTRCSHWRFAFAQFLLCLSDGLFRRHSTPPLGVASFGCPDPAYRRLQRGPDALLKWTTLPQGQAARFV